MPDIQKKRIWQSVASYISLAAFLADSVFCLATWVLSIIVSFSYFLCIYISQGSVATVDVR